MVTLLVSVVGIVVLSILYSAVFYDQSVEKTYGQLKIYMNVYSEEFRSAEFSEETAQALSEQLGGSRVTFLLRDGTVIADTEADGALESHLEREEVQEALSGGEGYSVRQSATLRENLVYYCRLFEGSFQLQDGTQEEGVLVRIAVKADSGFAIFADALPTMVWFLIVDIMCCLFVAWLATSFILRPVEKLTLEAAHGGGKEVQTEYAELKPLAKMMNDMNADLHEKVEKMKEDSRIEKLILNSMEHGIVLFRDPADVILINKTDLSDKTSLLRLENAVRAFNADAPLYFTTGARLPDENFEVKERTLPAQLEDITIQKAKAEFADVLPENVLCALGRELSEFCHRIKGIVRRENEYTVFEFADGTAHWEKTDKEGNFLILLGAGKFSLRERAEQVLKESGVAFTLC